MRKTYLHILDELGWPNVFLVPESQFQHIEGDKLNGDYEISAVSAPAIMVNPGLRGKVLRNSIYHGLGHQLFKSKPHWWVYLYGYIMARGGGDHQPKPFYGHTEADLPSRERLVHLSRLAARRFNKRRAKK